MRKPKKIIFIIADTLRAKNVGLYGANPSPTPVIDSLGKKGSVFANTYTSITKSDPSITAIMTGRYPISTGLISHGKWIIKEQERNLEKIPFLSEILQKNGFKTAAIDYFGRWHKRGFAYYSGKVVKDIDEKKIAGKNIQFLEYLRYLDALSIRILKRDLFVRFYYCFFSKVVVPRDPADAMIDDAIKVINKYKDKKLFLYIHFRDPHSPYIRPKGLRPYLFNSIEDRYNAEISFMDGEIGRLIEHLKKVGELDSTLIIFTADHGESLTEHNIFIAHHDPYEVVVKVPLVFYYNNAIFPKKINALIQNIDIFPTILELLGIDRPEGIDGVTLLPLIKGTTKKGRDFVFFDDNLFGQYIIKKSRRKLGVIFNKYKYIQTLEGKEEDLFQTIPVNTKVVKEELYDLSKDSGEKNNIGYKQKNILVKLKTILQAQIDSLSEKK
ncbi:MAG: sulfatase [Candidatus Levyibacteriota bacterium]